MGKQRSASLQLNYIYNLAYQVLTMIIPLITAPYISRVLLPEGVGVFSYTRSAAQYFLLFGMLGMNNYGSRNIAAVRDHKELLNGQFSGMYYFQLLMSGIATALYMLYVVTMVDRYQQVAAFQTVYVITSMLDVNWFFFGLEEFKRPVIGKAIIKLASTVLIFLLVHTPEDLGMYTLISSAGYMLGQAYMILYLRQYVHLVSVPFRDVLRHFKPCLVLFVPILATSVYRMMDKLMLGTLSSFTETGYYENSEKLITICLCVISALGTVMLPRMSNLYANNQTEQAKQYLAKSMQVAMLFSNAIAFGVGAVASEFIPIFYGEGYRACIPVTWMLVFTVLPISWANVIRMQYLIPNHRDRIYLISVCVSAAVNFVINALLIGPYGARGAAVGTIVAEFSVCIIQTVMVRKELDIPKLLKNSIFFLLDGCVMLAVVRLVSQITDHALLSLILEISVGAVTYLALALVYFIRSKNPLIYNVLKVLKEKTGKRDSK